MLAFLFLQAIALSPELYSEEFLPPSRGDERRKNSALVEYGVEVFWTDEDGDPMGETQTYWGKPNENLAKIRHKYRFLQPEVKVMSFWLKKNDDWF